MSTAVLERPIVNGTWHRMESPLRLLEAPTPRFRLLDNPVTLVDDFGEPASAVGYASEDDIEVL